LRSKPAPTSKELLEYIAEHEPLEATRRHFQLTREEVSTRLLGKTSRQSELPISGSSGAKPARADHGQRRLIVFCDGASRGNPGPAGAGAVIADPAGSVVARLGRFLGETTNNVAEYQGLLLGLSRAREMGATIVDVSADSELLVKQVKGQYRVKNAALKKLHQQAKALLAQFDTWSIRHVYREQNTEADEMSNRAIDERM
jgi:ribonuclease HI